MNTSLILEKSEAECLGEPRPDTLTNNALVPGETETWSLDKNARSLDKQVADAWTNRGLIPNKLRPNPIKLGRMVPELSEAWSLNTWRPGPSTRKPGLESLLPEPAEVSFLNTWRPDPQSARLTFQTASIPISQANKNPKKISIFIGKIRNLLACR